MARERFGILLILSFLAVDSLGVLPHLSLGADDDAGSGPSAAAPRKEAGLPLPSSDIRKRDQFVRQLYDFVVSRRYQNWEHDRHVRDTGDYIAKIYYGTHPAVRVYYSPAVMAWLRKGDRSRTIPDGAMIVKEQYDAPAARWEGKDDQALRSKTSGWTVMLRDSRGSKDGWYWADFGPIKADGTPWLPKYPHAYPFSFISHGFGQDCIRCHASAAGQSTFAELSNIDGRRPPLTFRVDDSWRSGAEQTAMEKHFPHEAVLISRITSTEGGSGHDLSLIAHPGEQEIGNPKVEADPEFLQFFDDVAPVRHRNVQVIPNETYDHVVPGSPERTTFFTSDQCMACHSGLADPFRAMFFIPGKPEAPIVYGNSPDAVNVSPSGEWRWSMMGLAGRDPVFYAQLASELKLHGMLPDAANRIANSCLSCHGVLGQRQFQSDHGFDKALTEGGNLRDARALPVPFGPSVVSITDPGDPNFKYGALTREGISCMACHRIQDPRIDEKGGQGLPDLIMARFRVGKSDLVFGPYADAEVVTLPMKNATGLTPKYNSQITKSRLCASCHILRVPVFKADGTTIKNHAGTDDLLHFEQATYLEWLNSAYQDEYGARSQTSKSCQQCHMPGQYHGKKLRERIATIEDEAYPAADERAQLDEIRVRLRDKFSRHELLGINVNVLEMFNQFDEILGVRKIDYMTGSAEGLRRAIDNAIFQAETASAQISVSPLRIDGSDLVADVQIQNLAGHRFPSGVGFRRAFVEFTVFDTPNNRDRLLWASGRTNALGVIVDQNGKPLPTEFFQKNMRGERYQPHFSSSHAITMQDQVQILEQVAEDPEAQITTSFLALFKTLKDNRLLPRGWTVEGPPEADLPEGWIMATHPVGTDHDRTFTDGRGAAALTYRVPLSDLDGGEFDPKQLKVVATLYYQSIPPFYLKDRFKVAPDDPATKRLHYLASHLDLSKTHVKGWKLRIASAKARLSSPGGMSRRE